jgi:hypothetical protein
VKSSRTPLEHVIATSPCYCLLNIFVKLRQLQILSQLLVIFGFDGKQTTMDGINKNRDNYHAAVAAVSGISATVVLGGLILLGSRRLSHFDAALVGYTFATLFAIFGITYRYAMWLQRPPTALPGFLIFHGLVWASFLVIAGVMIAMRRRMRGHDAFALQRFGEDFLPLILLFSVSITGLMLVVSYEWMSGYAYEFLSITHALTVIVTLLWLPFGKLFHLFQRPAQLGVLFYKDAGARGVQAHCARCREPYASQVQVDDLIEVERQLGYRYEMSDGRVDHYQRICPRWHLARNSKASRQVKLQL